jgi:hypothetical protein
VAKPLAPPLEGAATQGSDQPDRRGVADHAGGGLAMARSAAMCLSGICRGRWRFQNPLEGRPPFGVEGGTAAHSNNLCEPLCRNTRQGCGCCNLCCNLFNCRLPDPASKNALIRKCDRIAVVTNSLDGAPASLRSCAHSRLVHQRAGSGRRRLEAGQRGTLRATSSRVVSINRCHGGNNENLLHLGGHLSVKQPLLG